MSFASMPLFTGDYLRDTRHLTPAKHGIYLLFLMYCWDQKGPLPLDEDEQAGIANCRSADEMAALRYVREKYFVLADDGWYNQRICDEVARFEHIAEGRKRGGRASAQKRRAAAKAAKAAVSRAAQAAVLGEPELAGVSGGEHEFNTSSTEAELVLVSPTPTPTLTKEPKAKDLKASPAGAGEVVTNDRDDPIGDLDDEGLKGFPNCPVLGIVELYHDVLPELPRVEVVSDTRRRLIRSRWRDLLTMERKKRSVDTQSDGLAVFRRYFKFVRASDFLMGRAEAAEGRKPFVADLEWLMRPTYFARLMEGKYHGQ